MIMWLDNRNIATVSVDLNVTIYCCNLADEMFYSFINFTIIQKITMIEGMVNRT
jgi:hypothetical protein